MSPPGVTQGNTDSISTDSTSPTAHPECASCPAASVFIIIIIITITGGCVYIELPTKCKDLVSGVGCHLTRAYLYSLQVSSYFQRLSTYSNIYMDRRQRQRGAEGRAFMHRALEPAPGRSCQGGMPGPYPVRGGTHGLGLAQGKDPSQAEAGAAAARVGQARPPGRQAAPLAACELQRCWGDEEEEGDRNTPWAGWVAAGGGSRVTSFFAQGRTAEQKPDGGKKGWTIRSRFLCS